MRAHYRALWRMGISVDIVDEECVISGYKLVIAPMLYLLRDGFEEKLKAFVENGGTSSAPTTPAWRTRTTCVT